MKLHIAGLWQASPSSLLKGPKGDCYKREGEHFYDIPMKKCGHICCNKREGGHFYNIQMKKCGHIYVVTSADVDIFCMEDGALTTIFLSNIPIKFAQIFLAFFHMYSNGMELV